MDFLSYEKMHVPLQKKYKIVFMQNYQMLVGLGKGYLKAFSRSYFVFFLQGYVHLLVAKKVHFALVNPSQKVHILSIRGGGPHPFVARI